MRAAIVLYNQLILGIFMKEIDRYIATCPEEIKEVVAKELTELGAIDVIPGFKSVQFSCDKEIAYEIHLKLSTASRILRIVKECSGASPTILRNQASRIQWSKILPPNSTYLIDGVASDRGEKAMTSNEISKMVREGLQNHYTHINQEFPRVDLKKPKVVIVAFVYRKRAVISIDTSGKTLHKRGYRVEGHPAPLKETLAASILRLAGYDGSQPLYDPMCGSGTIAIEASYIAMQKATLIHRKKGDFGFEWLSDFDKNLWRKTQDRIRAERLESPKAPIFASDISPKYVQLSKDNALRARVEKFINFDQGSFFDMEPKSSTGILITNLPYGERLEINSDLEKTKAFYREIGDTLKQKYHGWTAALLTSEESPHKFIGLKPRRKIPILNGSIKCKLLIFDLYKGKKYGGSEA